ncbi:cupin domain-containing protein [uncultured Winogradskyella sp.]|uniref:cupin domain-containing protein n=1 Tax=uncultured Winogradskyella sp. TaxID=395353 RepID=UPI00261801B8|nr:cupin domain-containing protein [uncultured Winogradskyella sp.]
MNSIKSIVTQLDLKPHPEGGYFKETYRSVGSIKAGSLDKSYNGERNYSTCIYFLLTSDNFSALHRIKQDEIWHFYDGSPIRLHIITEAGEHSEHIIGNDLSKGQVPQFVVSGGCWFAAEVVEKDTYSLVGCTVSPGFSFEDFELKSQKELTNIFPHLSNTIAKLTHH